MTGYELDESNTDLIIEREGNDVAACHFHLLFGEGFIVNSQHFLPNSLHAHLQLGLLGVRVEDLHAKIKQGLSKRTVENKYLLVHHKLLKQLHIRA